MDGVINIYKPEGITSFGVVRDIRKICHTKKVGHTGTLDPLAKGVLPVCIGKATKIVDYIMNEFKLYRAHLKLGVVTDTYDREGKIIREHTVDSSIEEIETAINSFIGESFQIPPMYSALKVNGKKLYELARQGIEIEREKRAINIYEINILEISKDNVVFDVKCSKGTYIRSLCYDIGEKLGCGGVMWGLERLQTGTFNVANSIELNLLNSENVNNYIIPIETVLLKYGKINFDNKYESKLNNGVAIYNDFNLIESTIYRVYIENVFIGIGASNNNYFKMKNLFV